MPNWHLTTPHPPTCGTRSHTPGRQMLIIPCGGDSLVGWVVLRDSVRRVMTFAEAAATEPAGGAAEQPPPTRLPPEQQQQLVRAPGEQRQLPQQGERSSSGQHVVAPDVSSSSMVGPGSLPPVLGTSAKGTPMLTFHGRRVFFDTGATARGHYMRITEVARQER